MAGLQVMQSGCSAGVRWFRMSGQLGPLPRAVAVAEPRIAVGRSVGIMTPPVLSQHGKANLLGDMGVEVGRPRMPWVEHPLDLPRPDGRSRAAQLGSTLPGVNWIGFAGVPGDPIAGALITGARTEGYGWSSRHGCVVSRPHPRLSRCVFDSGHIVLPQPPLPNGWFGYGQILSPQPSSKKSRSLFQSARGACASTESRSASLSSLMVTFPIEGRDVQATFARTISSCSTLRRRATLRFWRQSRGMVRSALPPGAGYMPHITISLVWIEQPRPDAATTPSPVSAGLGKLVRLNFVRCASCAGAGCGGRRRSRRGWSAPHRPGEGTARAAQPPGSPWHCA